MLGFDSVPAFNFSIRLYKMFAKWLFVSSIYLEFMALFAVLTPMVSDTLSHWPSRRHLLPFSSLCVLTLDFPLLPNRQKKRARSNSEKKPTFFLPG